MDIADKFKATYDDGQVKPFFCFYGGKWRIAPKYDPPRFNTIIEPFAGAAGYSTRYYDRKVILIEKDPIIAALWEYLIKVSSGEIRSLPLIFDDVRDLNIPNEAKSLIGFWLNKGSNRPCNVPSKWMREGTRPKSFWGKEIRERIANQVALIKHWEIRNGDFWDIDNPEATWFIDPPYQIAGKHYAYNEIDYRLLGEWCKTRDGQVIVCEAQGATWLDFAPFTKAAANRSKHGKKVSFEVVYNA